MKSFTSTPPHLHTTSTLSLSKSTTQQSTSISTHPSNQPNPSNNQNHRKKMVYTLVVHLYAKDDQTSLDKLTAKLQEASQVYSHDKETLGWFVMRSESDPRAFTIVERYEHEGSQKSSYWQTFDQYVLPLLDRPMDLRRFHELDTSKDVRVETDEGMWEATRKHQASE
ncbi:Antibiotic biosynthesis monooxygenase [Teratosphaeria destructans]|uniref:Antibiotic biosynthesis monooxygenase n=1 Tax=Teratosphaeria destructans TaxID=418781 RepID=A0A9W7SPQ2_9PEZI|nr:Antibiotic biosynthesis monooxygenase [Teratosphaeria destructans]